MTLLALLADSEAQQTSANAGTAGAVVFVVLLLAAAFLGWNMNSRIKRMNQREAERQNAEQQ